ncbi:MAG: hypothetical protein FJW35_10500, partial [Acidobacteria bacterium]|nr:hypothetical protein [Acidobacteriota bacterium]
MTGEPFQPVRLYYSIPDRLFVVQRLRAMKCMLEVPPERCWQWLFQSEAASLRFPGNYDAVPKEKRPIVLGRLRFSKNDYMTLQTNSIPRAIEAARFFGPRLGPEVIAMRCRVVNRCFAAGEGKLDELMETLDRDITVIDPREAEAAVRREFAGVRKPQHAERTVAGYVERILESKRDVPLVEDFPLIPEEETPEFRELAVTLHLRGVRALEHWQGNTHLTLAA